MGLLRCSLRILIFIKVNLENGQQLQFYAKVCGVKGDWPWLRTVFSLSTGYNASRKCHLCPSTESWTVNAVFVCRSFEVKIYTPDFESLPHPFVSGFSHLQSVLPLRIGMTFPDQAQFDPGPEMESWLPHSKGEERRPYAS